MNNKIVKIEIVVMTIILITIFTVGALMFDKIDSLDIQILEFIRVNLTNDVLKNIMYVISMLLSPIPMLLMLGIFSIICKDRIVPILIAINSGSAVILNFILKNVFRRQRPFDYMIIDISGYSFPSAHAMVGFAFYGTLIYCVNKFIKKSKARSVITILLWILIILTPVSRVYLGVHNFSDVLVGSILGGIIVRVCIHIINGVNNKKEVNMLEESK